MTDDELIDLFEQAALPGEAFTHEAHVRAAWCYLTRYPFAEALWRFSTALRRFAAAQGAAEKYHETITVAWMAIVAGRIDEGHEESWSDFARSHADLLRSGLAPLAPWYSNAVLRSERAKRTFVLPVADGGRR